MPNWRLKVLSEKVLSCLPYRHKLNQALQMVRYGLRIGSPGRDASMRGRIPDVGRRLHHLGRHVPLEGAAVCDVGTGFGLPAILLYLAGAERIWSFDVVRQVTFGYMRRLLRVLRRDIAVCAGSLGAPQEVVDHRLAAIEQAASLDELFARANILYQRRKTPRRQDSPPAASICTTRSTCSNACRSTSCTRCAVKPGDSSGRPAGSTP